MPADGTNLPASGVGENSSDAPSLRESPASVRELSDAMHNGGWTGPVIQSRVRNALLSDGWLATSANAYDLDARTELQKARDITPDTYDRRLRIKRHQTQAQHYALHVAAFRELLYGRQRAARLAAASESDRKDGSSPKNTEVSQ